MDKLKISFPHMGDYHILFEKVLKILLPKAEMIPPPLITKKTVELGSRHSPDYVCAPFKYNMGNYIEALDRGANVLFQSGTGCRYGYYAQVQERILRDLGYEFRLCRLSREQVRPDKMFAEFKKLDPSLTVRRAVYAAVTGLAALNVMDRLDFYLRERIGFEESPGGFDRAKARFLSDLARAGSIRELLQVGRIHTKAYKSIPLRMPEAPIKVGIVGELYTLMEPRSNFHLERILAGHQIVVSRRMSLSFLGFGKLDRVSLWRSRGYLRHTVGANGADSVAQSIRYAKKGYDGIIHMKSSGCAPELNAEPSLRRVGQDYRVPVLSLSFDSQTGETGVQTRIEAFAEMLIMRRERPGEKRGQSGSRRRVHFDEGGSD